MDSRRLAEGGEWDLLRLRDVRPQTDRAHYGAGYAHRIMVHLSPHILQCRCVRELLPHLERRSVVASKVSSHILGMSDVEAASDLERLLVAKIHDGGNEAGKIENVYLALLDCYEEAGSVWCRNVAISVLRPAVRAELKLPEVKFYELAVVLNRVPSVNLAQNDADRLNDELGLTRYGPTNDLKKIVRLALSTKVPFTDLVSGLLLTPHTGRYLSLLLPYCHCNPPYVSEMLLKLGQSWRELALYLGYSEMEVEAVTRAGGGDPGRQVLMLLRVWWMPDCGKEKTQALLNKVVREKLNILHQPVRAKDDGLGLLNACLDGDWGKAEDLIQSGSHLEARSQDGRTPLMYACLRGKERIVELLVRHGADVLAMDRKGESCLNYTETLRNRVILGSILEEYKKQGVSVDVESLDTGWSPLSTACKCGAVTSAELLLEHGANPNGCKNGKHRPLVEASSQGHVGLVRTLLRYRADIDATGDSQNGYTALLQACNSHHWGVAQVLMSEGADVNKCAASDCTGPLFVAVTANEFTTASELIRKGAIVDAVRFQPGAVEGTVEVTPLTNAAGKGLNDMVRLLLDNGANINYLCSNSLPAIAFTILGDHVETFHMLLESPNLVKTLTGLTPAIMTSVRMEKYYYTEKLLDVFGGPRAAITEAHRDHMDGLTENIVMYMQAVEHPELPALSEGGFLTPQLRGPAPTPLQLRLGPGDQEKINSVLTDFCRICVSAVFYSSDIQVAPESLIEIAQATGNVAVAVFFRKSLSGSMTDHAMRHDFLLGEPSPFRFLIENKILTIDIFQIEVLKFRPDDAEIFYTDLVWTFRHMTGGADLPTNIESMLKQLFSGRFTPRTPPQSETRSTGEVHHGMLESSQPSYQTQGSEPSFDIRRKREKAIEANLKDIHLTMNKTGDDAKGNPSLPEGKSKGVRTAVENVENNVPSRPQMSTDVPLRGARVRGARVSADLPEIPTKDKARIRVVKPVRFGGINAKLGGFAPYSTTVTQPIPVAAATTPQQSHFGHMTGTLSPPAVHQSGASFASSPERSDAGSPPSRASSEDSSAAASGSGEGSHTTKTRKAGYLANCLVHPTGVVLGGGAYGDVLEVEHKGVIYAAKKYRISTPAIASIGALSREHEIFTRINHPNIVPYFGVCKLATDKSTVIVMERMDKNLDSFLKEKSNIALEVKFKLLTDIARGLSHLHEQTPAIIHRDLTAGNVLLNSNGVAKISDFGNSRMIDLCATPEIFTSNPGTLDYMPPEALEGGLYSVVLDIFSYGHLGIHIIIQHRPHPLLRHTYKLAGKLLPRTEVERRGQYLHEMSMKLDGGTGHTFYKLVVRCLNDDPDSRPSCKDVLDCIKGLRTEQIGY